MSPTKSFPEPIAVVGTGCRFPGNATDPAKLWNLLSNPVDLSRDVPNDRFSRDGFFHPDGERHGTTNAVQGYWLEGDFRKFDASFFNITPKEAEAIDPQQKMLLEAVYEGMESAGLTLGECSGKKIGVYVGIMSTDYTSLVSEDKETMSQYTATGTARSIISNRISYFFNWHGPSMTIDTACSSSLVAVHQAMQSLRSDETTICCAAGATLMLTPDNFIAEASLHMLSPTGTSKMWDASADGYARGDGIGVLFMKTLSRALADGDDIEFIIRETGVNSDGRSKGITMPSSEAQAALIRDTYTRAGLDPQNPLQRCQFFEAHGTGTQAGDPREAEAIHSAFFGDVADDSRASSNEQRLLVGSIKTIIGHTESTAGIAGILKTALAMQHGLVPANQHLHTINPTIAPFMRNLEVPTKPTPWPDPPNGQPLRGSVNSFGFGGTNSHAILERYDPSIHDAEVNFERPPTMNTVRQALVPAGQMFPFSAHSGQSLFNLVKNFKDHLESHPDLSIRDFIYTLTLRRSHLPQKIAFCGVDRDDVLKQMNEALIRGEETDDASLGIRSKPTDGESRILGIFTGQGAQWAGMAKDLLTTSPVFAESIRAMEEVLKACPDPPSWRISDELRADATSSHLHQAEFSQPLCTALQIATVDVLRQSGVRFGAVVGHSSGEIGAAYAAGVLSARDAILVAYYRGFYAHLAGGYHGARGSMLAAGISVDEAIDLCEQAPFRGRIFVAATNSPASVTLSGDADAISDAMTELKARKVFARAVKVDTAYHSHHMEPCAESYVHALLKCKVSPNAIESDSPTWVSSVYGPVGEPSAMELRGTYWRDNMTQPVLFTEALHRALIEQGPFDAAIEVGPHPALKGPATQTMQEAINKTLPYTGTLARAANDLVSLARAASFLWSHLGTSSIDLAGFTKASGIFDTDSQPRLQVVKGLPTYPWNHTQPHFRDSRVARQYLDRAASPNELLGSRTADDSDSAPRWRNILKPDSIPWLRNHRFQGQLIVPAAAYCVMALEASKVLGSRLGKVRAVELYDMVIENGISMSDDSPGMETLFAMTIDHASISGNENGNTISASFSLEFAPVDGERRLRRAAHGRVTVQNHPLESLPMQSPRRMDMHNIMADDFYSSIQDTGLSYTGPFKAMSQIKRRLNHSTAVLDKPHPEDTCTLSVRPAMLDSAFQAAFVAFAAPLDGALWTAFLPQTIDRIRFTLPLCEIQPGRTEQLDIDAYVTQFSPTTVAQQANFSADIEIYNPRGEMEIQIEGLTVVAQPSVADDDQEFYLETVFLPDAGQVTRQVETKPSMPHGLPDHGLDIESDKLCSYYHQKSDLNQGWTTADVEKLISTSVNRPSLELLRTFAEQDLCELIPGLTKELRHELAEVTALHHELTRVVGPICHRYPRMRILELDYGGAGRSTSSIIGALKNAYASYTYAHSAVEAPHHLGKGHSFRKFSTRALQPQQRIRDQDIGEQSSFDMIVVSQPPLGELESPTTFLEQLRSLLIPGGFLIVLEFAQDLLRERLIRCLQGAAVAEQPRPVRQIKAAMTSMGFSSPLHEHETAIGKHVILVSQALDSTVQALVSPLQADKTWFALNGDILIVGGESPSTQSIFEHVRHALQSRITTRVIHAQNFETIQPSDTVDLSAAIILADLDEPIMANLTEAKMSRLSEIFRPHRSVLWLTSGFLQDNPYHSASIGLGRTVEKEVPQLMLQFLDLADPQNPASGQQVSEAFLRLLIGQFIDRASVLWTVEHEIRVLEDGSTLLPRVLPSSKLNDRKNSIRRAIIQDVDPAKIQVTLSGGDDKGYSLTHTSECAADIAAKAEKADNVRLVRFEAISVHAYDIGGCGHLFIGAGQDDDGSRVVALSSVRSSYALVPCEWTWVMTDELQASSTTLVSAAIRILVAQHLSQVRNPGQSILVHGGDPSLAATMKKLVAEGVGDASTSSLHFSTTAPGLALQDDTFILFDRGSARRSNRVALPNNIVKAINLSRSFEEASILKNTLSNDVVIGDGPLRDSATMSLSPKEARISRAFGNAMSQIPGAIQTLPQASAMRCSDVTGLTRDASAFAVVDWSATATVPTALQTLDTKLFSAEKTYLMVGLTGDLGQSLCKYMVQHGARHIVVVSRNPDRNPPWKEELEKMGGKIMITSMDASNIADVRHLKARLSQTHPPIAGVVNGAMVLHDGLFTDLKLADFQKVLRPKIDGSNNLDAVFAANDLEFFIMFSSLTAVPGNSGQSNYTAANLYMAGLVGNRRKRGLHACCLDIGLLYGIGYVNRIGGADIYKSLRSQGYRPQSERDVHQMFVEAIAAGRPSATDLPWQVITGLQRFSTLDRNPLPWHFDPRFSHLTKDADRAAAGGIGGLGDVAESIAEQISTCSSEEAVAETLKKCFGTQLEIMLQLNAGSINADAPIVDLGVDSLVAVTIRSWFLKEVNQDMPVLKILSGASLSQLIEDITPAIFAAAKQASEGNQESLALVSSESSDWALSGDGSSLSSGEKGGSDGSWTPPTSNSENEEAEDLGDEDAGEISGRRHEMFEKVSFMAAGQARMWLPCLLSGNATAYNCTTTYRLRGPLDIVKFEEAIMRACHRHEPFRTAYFSDPSTGEAMQAVRAHSDFRLEHIPIANDGADVEAAKQRSAEHVYDLENADVFLAILLRHDLNMYTIVFGYHHIMIDAVSWQMFLQDIERYYVNPSLRLALPVPFIDFVREQRQMIESKAGMEKRNYWKNELSPLPQPLALLPFAKVSTRRSLRSYSVRESFVELDRSLVVEIRNVATRNQSTPFHVYLAVLQVLLHRWLGIDDMCLGMTDANRSEQGFMKTVGLLLESLPLRFRPKSDERFQDRLQRTRDTVYGALGNSGVPLDTILNDVRAETAPTHSPLFQALVNFRMGSIQQKSIGDVAMDYVSYEDAKHPFDFIVTIDEDEGRAGITLSMQDYMFDKAGMNLFMDTYIHLLGQFSNDPTQSLAQPPLYPRKLRDQAVALGRGSKLSRDWPATIPQCLQAMSDQFADNVALQCGNKALTYSQLSREIDFFVGILQKAGARHGSRVAMFCDKSLDAIITMLATMRAGAIYVPLDSRNSDDRLSTIAKESAVRIVVYHSETQSRLPLLKLSSQVKLVEFATQGNVGKHESYPGRSTESHIGSDIAAIMYTSGTTGKPKGIALSHTNLITHIAAVTEALDLKQEVVLQQSAFGYDASIAQTFYALCNGGTLIMSNNRGEMQEMATRMRDTHVSLTLMAPSEYLALFQHGGQDILRACHGWKIALCGGESFPQHLLREFRSLELPSLELYNEYGPTEIAVASSIHHVRYRDSSLDQDEHIPIGRSMPGYDMLIVDERMQPAPQGWPGQIAAAGPAVSIGYVEDPTLTEAKFVQNPAVSSTDNSMSRMYLTGDRGRMLEDGSIVHLGRMGADSQIKLRGIRIELAEISTAIIRQSNGYLADVEVGIHGNEGADQFLVAYVVFARSESAMDNASYLSQLLASLPLPVYMRPAMAIPLDTMPMNASGKLDRRALKTIPLPEVKAASEMDVLTSTEQKLAQVWRQAIGHGGIGLDNKSNFFAAGGTSLSLLRLQALIVTEFAVKIALPELFDMPSLEWLALRLDGAASDNHSAESRESSLSPLSGVSTPASSHIDWQAETKVDSAALALVLEYARTHQSPKKGVKEEGMNIVVTGSTGFLGQHIIQQLASCGTINRIHCVAVRRPESSTTQALKSLSHKVVVHAGDLSLPGLGLCDEDSVQSIFGNAHAIIHNGADVSFMKPYTSLRGPNVEATKYLAHQALAYDIPIHYISTAGVAVLSGSTFVEEESMASHPPVMQGIDGYVSSKWASEVYLENLQEQGLKVRIYRPSTITGDGAPSLDIMQNVLRFSRKMRTMPRLEGWKGAFDMIEVDVAAEHIVNGALGWCQGLEKGETVAIDYLHLSGQTVVLMDEAQKFLEAQEGVDFEIVDIKEWARRGHEEQGMHELVRAYLDTLADSPVKPSLPQLQSRIFG